MAEIRQRISLEGGADIKKQLEELGQAGADAFKKLQNSAAATGALNAFNNIVAKGKEIGNSLGALGSAASHFGEAVESSVSRVGLALGLAGGGIIEVAKSFTELVKSSAKADDELLKTAETIGITVRSLSNLQFGAGQAGIDSDKFTQALIRLEKAIGEAGKRSLDYNSKLEKLNIDERRRQQDASVAASNFSAQEKEQITAFNRRQRALEDLNRETANSTDALTRLGITVKDENGDLKKADEVLLEIADAFKEMEDGPKKAALALELFGKGNARMIPFLNQGTDGIKRFNEEASKIAPPPDKLELIANRALSDSFDALERSAESAKNSILSVFSPLATQVVEAFTEAIVANRATLVTFAGEIANKIRPAAEALIHTLESGEAVEFLVKATDSAIAFGGAVKSAVTDIIVPAFNALLKVLQVVAEAINGVFGTNLTGGELGIILVLTKLLGLFPLLTGAVQIAITAFGVLATLFGGPLVAAIAIVVGFLAFKLVQALSDVDWASWAKSAISWITSLSDWFAQKFDAIIQKAKDAANWIKNIFTGGGSNTTGEQFGPPTPEGFAGGGHVRGRGTGTSDSILARLSNGEFVLTAATVRKVGVGFLNMLNRARDPLKGLLSGFSGGGLLDLGGLMPRGIPGFAAGGAVSVGAGGQPLTFVLDGRAIGGISGTPDAVKQLMRFARRGLIGSAGRKPSWYKG